VLFATTVLENIRYGRPSASDTEVCSYIRLHTDTSCWTINLFSCIDRAINCLNRTL